MMKISFIASSLLLLSPCSFALDLVEAYERAKNTDPNWQANIYQYQADQLNLGLAKGNLLPTVTLSGNITRKHQDLNQTENGSNEFFNSSDLMSSTKQIADSINCTALASIIQITILK